ncbi:MAG: OmpA family protein [Terracidiphilus sp.]
MKLILRSLLVAVFAAVTVLPAIAQQDEPGSKDFPGISRMSGYWITHYNDTVFDAYKFSVKENGKEREESVEGRHVKIRYRLQDNLPKGSTLQVLRNYQNAARAAGGKVLFEGEFTTTIRLPKSASEVWLEVNARSAERYGEYDLNIVEKQTMKQEVTMDAAAMAQGLNDAGEVAIYGIYFDTAKSDLKPESDPALGEIAKLLKEHPALRVYIVGHTDMVGDAAANVKLSQVRAQAVVTALTTRLGVAPTRLIAYGAGPYAPVATNKTEDGRAKNRRVELVEIATK